MDGWVDRVSVRYFWKLTTVDHAFNSVIYWVTLADVSSIKPLEHGLNIEGDIGAVTDVRVGQSARLPHRLNAVIIVNLALCYNVIETMWNHIDDLHYKLIKNNIETAVCAVCLKHKNYCYLSNLIYATI